MGLRKLINRLISMITNKRVPAAADRNKDAICTVLKTLLPADKDLKALEIASGSGLHVALFAANFPRITWTPSEVDTAHWPSLLAYAKSHKNIEDPLEIDISSEDLNLKPDSYNVIININMIHISPWAATQGLFRNAGLLLKADGLLITYGPYAKNGTIYPESNVQFNRYLKNENTEWGLRDIADLSEEGNEHGLFLQEEFDMPANNKILVFRRNKCLG